MMNKSNSISKLSTNTSSINGSENNDEDLNKINNVLKQLGRFQGEQSDPEDESFSIDDEDFDKYSNSDSFVEINNSDLNLNDNL